MHSFPPGASSPHPPLRPAARLGNLSSQAATDFLADHCLSEQEFTCLRLGDGVSEINLALPLGRCIHVTEDAIVRIHAIASRFATNEAKIEAAFKGGRTLTVNRPEDFFSDGFVRSTRLNSLCISASNMSCRLRITFEDNFLGPIYVTFSGNRPEALNFEQEIRHEIEAISPVYSVLRPKILQFEPAVYAFFIQLAFWALYLIPNTYTCVKDLPPLITLLWSDLFLFAIIYQALLPRLVFNFGRGSTVYNALAVLRSIVLVGIILAVGVNLFSSFVYDRVK